MIVFRKQEKITEPREHFARIKRLVHQSQTGSSSSYEDTVDILVEFGEFEAAVVDALCKGIDDDNCITQAFRELGILTGSLLFQSWSGETAAHSCLLERIKTGLAALSSIPLPELICVRVAEGYVHYGIFPEMYLEAARKFHHAISPGQVVCIGIRSIGTSLSSVVGATLQELGCDVHSFTVRPRGHPFNRRILLTLAMERKLTSFAGALYLIVDEGPGLSGSSLCSAAQKLSELGIEDDRIILFPCWEPDGTDFVNKSARDCWRRHRKFTATFEEVWIQNGRLSEILPLPPQLDISAGRWRALFYSGESSYPAVHPHHEQRKFVCADGELPIRNFIRAKDPAVSLQDGNGLPLLAKFAGLGRYGKLKLARGLKLAERGFTPRPVGLVNGFLITEFVRGEPVSRQDVIRKDLLDTVAQYAAYLKTDSPGAPDASTDEIMEMIRTNIGEGLGSEWVKRFDQIKGTYRVFDMCEPVAVDGRMLPHDWIRTTKGFLKSDSLDHHTDQFFPRSQDIAWDISAVSIEFGLDRSQRNYLVERYRSLTGDRFIRHRLPFYSLAYIAYRLGYVSLCAASLGSTPDGVKFRASADRYASMLKRLIAIYEGTSI
ncbi:MAG: hypothetical protein ACE14T_12000 [Syntrophales bacterium]